MGYKPGSSTGRNGGIFQGCFHVECWWPTAIDDSGLIATMPRWTRSRPHRISVTL